MVFYMLLKLRPSYILVLREYKIFIKFYSKSWKIRVISSFPLSISKSAIDYFSFFIDFTTFIEQILDFNTFLLIFENQICKFCYFSGKKLWS